MECEARIRRLESNLRLTNYAIILLALASLVHTFWSIVS